MFKQIVVILIFVLLIGGGFLIYYFYEKPLQEQSTIKANLSISAKEDGKFIVTGYKLKIDNYEYPIGKTLKNGFLFETIPINSTIEIENVNLENQTYYTQNINFTSREGETYRLDLDLKKPSNLSIWNEGYLGDSNIVNLYFSGEKFKDIMICVKWSTHIIYVRSNLELSDKPNNYRNYDKCFNSGINIIQKSQFNVTFEYDTFGVLDSSDSILFAFIDSDRGITEKGGEDVGGENFVHTLNINNI